MGLVFEWDPAKAKQNLLKHGVSFKEACSVLADPLSLTIADRTHSSGEDRFLTVGSLSDGRLLVVVHTDRQDRIRMISARRATPRERRVYEEE